MHILLAAAPGEDETSFVVTLLTFLGAVGAIGPALMAYWAKVFKSRNEPVSDLVPVSPPVSDPEKKRGAAKLHETQVEIYEKHHRLALRAAETYTRASYVAFAFGILILAVAAVLFFSGAKDGSIIVGSGALIDLVGSGLLGTLSAREQARADRKLDQVTARLDRRAELDDLLKVAEHIQDPKVRDSALARLVEGGLRQTEPEQIEPVDEPSAPDLEEDA